MKTVDLLHYRPWRGEYRPPFLSIWPVTRVSLRMIFRRKLFWVIYAFGLMVFLFFFFGQYLLTWIETQAAEANVRVGGFGRADPRELIQILRHFLKLNGSGETYRNFIGYQGYAAMTALALGGSLLIGNDIRFGSLVFYLSKPLSRWHYLAGKCLAIGVFVNLMTTIPALILFVQYGLLDSWDYFIDQSRLFFGILGYGLVLTVCLSLLASALATWLRRTVPLVMAWTTLFFFLRLLCSALVDGLHYDRRWRLMDLWNDMYLVGERCLGINPPSVQLIRRGDFQYLHLMTQPLWWQAAMVLGMVCSLCLTYLILRIRAVEIVR